MFGVKLFYDFYRFFRTVCDPCRTVVYRVQGFDPFDLLGRYRGRATAFRSFPAFQLYEQYGFAFQDYRVIGKALRDSHAFLLRHHYENVSRSGLAGFVRGVVELVTVGT